MMDGAERDVVVLSDLNVINDRVSLLIGKAGAIQAAVMGPMPTNQPEIEKTPECLLDVVGRLLLKTEQMERLLDSSITRLGAAYPAPAPGRNELRR